jgi:hypothetical protein
MSCMLHIPNAEIKSCRNPLQNDLSPYSETRSTLQHNKLLQSHSVSKFVLALLNVPFHLNFDNFVK